MDISERLEELRTMAREIEGYRERIAKLESAMEMQRSMTGVKVKSGRSGDRMASNIAKLDELRKKLMVCMIDLEARRSETIMLIAALPSQQRDILRLRYVECKEWAEIAAATAYSVDHCYTIHRTAIRHLER